MSLPVSPNTIFYTQHGGKKSHFIYAKKMLESLMCVYIQPECAVCVREMFNNHYNNFLPYTSQIGPGHS